MAVSLGIAARRGLFLFQLISSGQPSPGRLKGANKRIGLQFVEVFGQKRLLKWSVPGIAHAVTFWAFIILTLTILEAVGALFDPHFAIPIIGEWRIVGFAEDLIATLLLVSLATFALIRRDEDPAKKERSSRFYGSHTGPAWLVQRSLAHVIDADKLFIKKFEDVGVGKAAPGEAEVEVYTAGDRSYTELENQGVYATIASKDSVTWRVKWFARKLPASVKVSVGSTGLTSYIEDVLKREDLNTKVEVTNKVVAKIYPNPAAGLLTIETAYALGKNVTLRIFDLQGRLVLTHPINQFKVQINIKNLQQGYYIYDLKQETVTVSKGQIAILH